MIFNFSSDTAQDIFDGVASKAARKISPVLWPVIQRKLDMLNAAEDLGDLKAPPGNRLEALKGGLQGRYSIRVNDQYRIIFEFRDGSGHDVDVVDYH